MSDAQALQAVEMEMGSRYQSNPWDAPALAPAGGLKSMRMGRREEEEKEWGWEVGMGKERREQGYSQSEWDDFEHFLGYR